MKKILFICLIVSAFLLSGCYRQSSVDTTTNGKSSATVSTASTNSTSENTVTIAHFAFDPSELTIKVGDTVNWKHDDNVTHTIVSEGLFKSDPLQRGDEFTFTFTSPGEYAYRCGIHPSMTGKIIVK